MQSQEGSPYLYSLPIIGPFLKQTETDGIRYGWPEAIRKAAERINLMLNTSYDSESARTSLESDPVLLIGNHPYEVEILALAATIPNRSDVYAIANVNVTTVIPSASDHIIPVYINYHQTKMYKKTWLRIQLERFHTFVPPLSKEEEHKKNIESISSAARFVSQGHLVMIFPDRHSLDGHWFNGVGYLAKQITPELRPKVIFSFVEGTSSRDIWRLFPIVRKILSPITVTYSNPIDITPLTALNPKDITKELESRYRAWCKTIGKKYIINGA